jgi:hypothetical protein
MTVNALKESLEEANYLVLTCSENFGYTHVRIYDHEVNVIIDLNVHDDMVYEFLKTVHKTVFYKS